MREIKFRVWTGSQMVYEPDCQTERLNDVFREIGGRQFMMYTGQKDKTGKEIYEGDVTNYGEVIWVDKLTWDGGGSPHPGFYFKNSYSNELDYGTGFEEDIEIFGNIFENPEL